MGSVRRLYVEKKKEFAVEAEKLAAEIKNYLGLTNVSDVRVVVRYDVENISDDTFERAINGVFSEPPVDNYYKDKLEVADNDFVISVEYLPGQFDQRADSAEQCIALLGDSDAIVKCASTYVISGNLTDEDKNKIKNILVNPIDQRVAEENVPATLEMTYATSGDVEVLEGFIGLNRTQLEEKYNELSLAMTFADFKLIQGYFLTKERRDPSITEIRVLDTYWSDHCRHTTFATELKKIIVNDGYYKSAIERILREYTRDHNKISGEKKGKYVSLMDMATLAAKKQIAEGDLTDQEKTDEINACSIIAPIMVDGVEEEWLINFKNETHNHPTEIEPFGGAATCLGGAIRDPLSGRTYVYQAMRITGAADPRTSIDDTLNGKLPQRKIVTEAAHGYSSYGNQIGLATGLVKEIYHPNFVAKHMELGAVLGAAKRENVMRETSDPGNIIVLLGGRTGRDGIGGATGSSKAHTNDSIDECGAEVQKGNAPTERKIQRLFRRPEVTKLIRKCNDFGAGGVSVAVGELADGLLIDLDKVTKKYEGLDGTELAISESQERMAVVLDKNDVDTFLSYASEENLEATPIAEVTKEKRLVMKWRDKVIVDISREFLDTNGAHQKTTAAINSPSEPLTYGEGFVAPEVTSFKDQWLKTVSDLNNCSQRGLVERFDSSIGAGTVTMPYGGKNMATEMQSMISKVPVLHGTTDAITYMSYGYDPYLSSWSPLHGSIYAILESLSKIVANGADYRKAHLSLQEYFGKMTDDPERWGLPTAALLGAYSVQNGLKVAAIGGKDSMSGTFEDIDVPPTLCSFAVAVGKEDEVVTPELKQAGNLLVKLYIKKDDYDLPVYERVALLYHDIYRMMLNGTIVSAYVADRQGISAAISKMAFGSGLGVELNDDVSYANLFAPSYADFVVEIPADREKEFYRIGNNDRVILGRVIEEPVIKYKDETLTLDEVKAAWEGTLEDIYPTKSKMEVSENIEAPDYSEKDIYICKNKVAKPRVFIPVFPGTNCEYDTARAFELAGAETDIRVFKNLTAEDIKGSVEAFTEGINNAQIVMFPGGFSAGDEPEGSAKFFATAFRNEKMSEAVNKLLNERDGLALGICNGFQALIKLGLVPNGKITGQDVNAPTLTFNTIDRHIAKHVYTRVVSNKSPWLAGADLGGVYAQPVSHGEGRFYASVEVAKELFANGQVATRYCDADGNISMDEAININGSVAAIEGITSKDGRVFGKMAHPERIGKSVAVNIAGNQDMKIFESGVKYFK